MQNEQAAARPPRRSEVYQINRKVASALAQAHNFWEEPPTTSFPEVDWRSQRGEHDGSPTQDSEQERESEINLLIYNLLS